MHWRCELTHGMPTYCGTHASCAASACDVLSARMPRLSRSHPPPQAELAKLKAQHPDAASKDAAATPGGTANVNISNVTNTVGREGQPGGSTETQHWGSEEWKEKCEELKSALESVQSELSVTVDEADATKRRLDAMKAEVEGLREELRTAQEGWKASKKEATGLRRSQEVINMALETA